MAGLIERMMSGFRDDKADELKAKYRVVFLQNAYGLDVLDDILRECSFFSTLSPEDPGQIALHNLGKMILAKCGILAEDTTRGMVEALSTLNTEV